MSPLRLGLLTPPLLLIAHYLAVLPHEFGHRLTAWALGAPIDPWAIDWGGMGAPNLLLLIHIDDRVDYAALLAAGPAWHAALTAFAGPGINGGLAAAARIALGRAGVPAHRPAARLFLFWFWLVNLANLYDYVPMRVFGTGDMRHFLDATGWSPWPVYVLGTWAVGLLILDGYVRVLPRAARALGLDGGAQGGLMVAMTLVLFGYFALPGALAGELGPRILGVTSLMSIPAVVWAAWPRKGRF